MVSRRPLRTLLATAVGLTCLGIALIWQPPSRLFSQEAGDLPDEDTIGAFVKGGCIGCHTIPGVPNASGLVGPNLAGIGAAAGDRISGTDAESYLRESILNPDAFIAPSCPLGDCPASVMPPNMADRLTGTEVDLIVSYLLTLQAEGIAQPELYTLIPIEIERPPETTAPAFAPPPNTYDDAQVLLGQYLFFDRRLSGDATVSCASCHRPENAFAGSEALSPGYTGTRYFRNTPTVMNTAFADVLYWDGRMDGSDMPTLVRDHLTEAHFMNTDGRLMVERVKQVPEYVQLFEDAFGSPPSFGRVLNAITAYVQSLNSSATPYDRHLAGEADALTADAAAGLELFNASCASCHSGPLLSDNNFYVTGVPENNDIWGDPLRHITFRRFFRQLGTPNYRALETDPGHYALTLNQDDRGAFRTAPLREIGRTAPYMHNGVFATLEEVVAFYDETLDLKLTDEEINQLVAFLQALDSEPVAVEIPNQPDYQLRTLGENR